MSDADDRRQLQDVMLSYAAAVDDAGHGALPRLLCR